MTERRSEWTLPGGFSESELSLAPEEREKEPHLKCVNAAEALGYESDVEAGEKGELTMNPAQSVVVYRGALKREEAPPLFIGIPHSGEMVPEELWGRAVNREIFGPRAGLDVGSRAIFAPSRDEFLAVRTRLSRAVVDCNREPTDFEGKAPSYMAVSWTKDLQGQPIYAAGQELRQEEKERLVSQFYNAYYRRLHAVAATLLREHQQLLFVDGHSFPGDEEVLAYGIRADEPKPLILLGTGKGKVKVLGVEEEIVETLKATLEREIPDEYRQWSPLLASKVEVNKIWTGTRNIRYWGREEWVRENRLPPATRAIQIEVNRSGYFKDGKYDRKRLDTLHQAIYAGLQEVAKKIQ